MLIRHHAHPGIPGIKHIPVLILRFLPKTGIPSLDRADEFLRFALNLGFRMHGREQNEMDFNLAQFRSLLIYRPMGAEKDDDVERDDSEGDDGPTAPLHVFMAKRD